MENRRWFNTVFLFCNGDKPKSEFAENLAIAYNPGICLLALPVILSCENPYLLVR